MRWTIVALVLGISLAGCTVVSDDGSVPEHTFSPGDSEFERPEFERPERPSDLPPAEHPEAQVHRVDEPFDPLCGFEDAGRAPDHADLDALAPHPVAFDAAWACVAVDLVDVQGDRIAFAPTDDSVPRIIAADGGAVFAFDDEAVLDTAVEWIGVPNVRATPDQARAHVRTSTFTLEHLHLGGGTASDGRTIPGGSYRIDGGGTLTIEWTDLAVRSIGRLQVAVDDHVGVLGHPTRVVDVLVRDGTVDIDRQRIAVDAGVDQVFHAGEPMLPASIRVELVAENVIAITELDGHGTAHGLRVQVDAEPRTALGNPRDTVQPDWFDIAWELMEGFMRGQTIGLYLLVEQLDRVTVPPAGTVYVPIYNSGLEGESVPATVTVSGSNIDAVELDVDLIGMRPPDDE